MNILEFIFGIIALLVGALVVIGTVTTIWDNNKLQEENKKLNEDLHNARKRKMEKESKK